MKSNGRKAPALECPYCGAKLHGGRACAAHRDLLELDPTQVASKRPLTDAEQGAGDPLRVSPRAGRRELY